MTDLICRKTMMRCQTQGMCAPFGGCQPSVLADCKTAQSNSRDTPSPAGVDGWDVAGDILEKLSAAQAIIDGLRGEVGSQRVKTCTALKERNDAREQRDQLAGLLRESEKTISQLQAERPTSRRIARYLDAMRAKINTALAALPK